MSINIEELKRLRKEDEDDNDFTEPTGGASTTASRLALESYLSFHYDEIIEALEDKERFDKGEASVFIPPQTKDAISDRRIDGIKITIDKPFLESKNKS